MMAYAKNIPKEKLILKIYAQVQETERLMLKM